MEPYSILRYFAYAHLPEHLQKISEPFSELAHKIATDFDSNDIEETVSSLRKLLEAKDCAVRSALK